MISQLMDQVLEIMAWGQGYASAMHAYFAAILGGSALGATAAMGTVIGMAGYWCRHIPMRIWQLIKRWTLYTYTLQYDRFGGESMLRTIAERFETELQKRTSKTRNISRIIVQNNRLKESLSSGAFYHIHNGVVMRISRGEKDGELGKKDQAGDTGSFSSIGLVDINITALRIHRRNLMKMLEEMAPTLVQNGVYQIAPKVWGKSELPVVRLRNIVVPRNMVMEPEVKKLIDAAIDNFLEHRERRLKEGLPCKLTFMLHGEPGSGKSAAAEYIANRLNTSLFVANGLTVKNRDGSSISLLVQSARENISDGEFPVILLDDFDTTFPEVRSRKLMAMEASDSTIRSSSAKSFIKTNSGLGEVLADLQSPTEVSDCVLVFTTNHLENIDGALYRPGRITNIIRLPRMSQKSVKEYYRLSYNQPWPEGAMLTASFRACDLSNYYDQHPENSAGFLSALLNHTMADDEKFALEMAELEQQLVERKNSIMTSFDENNDPMLASPTSDTAY